jgi:predicted permease
MDTFAQDIRLALRQFGRAPAFTLTVLATLALAIGATTAVFSLVDGVLLNPLGFSRPERLVYLEAVDPKGNPDEISPQDLMDFQHQSRNLSAIASVESGRSQTLTRESGPAVRLNGARVGGSFFDILGVAPEAGHFFQPGSDAKDAPRVVVLSDRAWHREFGGDPRIVGSKIRLRGEEVDERGVGDSLYQVVGIAPPQFTFPGQPDLWLPAVWLGWEIGDTARGYHSVNAIARLSDGVTLDAARRELAAIAYRIAQTWPKYDAKISATAKPLREQLVGSVERPLWVLFGAVVFVLLIACVNISNLMLSRATARASEVAVRTALGASPARLARQFVTESVVLAFAGTALGILVASWIVDAVVRFGPSDLPRLTDVSMSASVLAFSALIAVLTGIGFGVAPALHLSRTNASVLLRAGARGITGGAQRTRALLVLTEIALGTVLLVGAGLLVRSFVRLLSVDPGFRADNVIVFDLALAGSKYLYDAQENRFAEAVLTRLAALPGVTGVAVAANRPFDRDPGFSVSTSFTIDGQPKPEKGMEPESRLLPVSPSYFATMGMTLLRGRTFTDQENRLGAAPVVVINEALAARDFPGQNPIGKRLTFGINHTVSADPKDTLRTRGEIIGVVRTVTHTSLAAKPEPATYVPYAVLPFGPSFAVRTIADRVVAEREIRSAVAAVDRDAPVYGLQTLNAAVAASVERPRFYTVVCGAFAAVALLLAAVGIYGVISYGVSQRSREFGVRIALGATPNDVVALVLRSGTRLTLVGLAIGLVGAVLATRTMSALLFGVSALDGLTFAVVCLVLAGAATLASWLPARRAAAVDPVVAMRAE